MSGYSEKVEFLGAHGHTLAARLDMPDGEPVAFALFAHCFTCSKDVFAASRIASGLAERGIAVLRFDFTGLGDSEGEFANTHFSSNVADLEAAAAWLTNHHAGPALLIGHSLGGAAVLAAAPRIASARAVVAINAPAGPSHVRALFGESVDRIEAEGQAEVSIGGRPFTIRREFLDDIDEHRLCAGLAHLRKALLLFHAPLDQIVSIDNAAMLYRAARHPKSFVSLDDADHLLTRREDAVYVADVIAAWSRRYLGAGAEPRPALADRPLDHGVTLVAENGLGPYAQTVVTGRHRLRADEPLSVGGTDTGPGPYDLLLAGLGACTSMTIRMYAERKKLPLDRVAVRLTHRKIHATDCADCDSTDGKVDVIDREIELTGNLDGPARARLLEIADKCPVHRTLHGEIKVRTVLAPEDTGI